MSQDPASILLVEDDDDVGSMIADYVERTMKANVKRVSTASEAIASGKAEHHDVILADVALPDNTDLGLVRDLRRGGDCEIILMTGRPTLGRALEAMRMGVRDMLAKPFDMHYLGNTLRKAVSDTRRRRRERLRYDRLRRVSSRIIRERRVLKERVDLVCRDLVGAYRRLAEKVVHQRPSPE